MTPTKRSYLIAFKRRPKGIYPLGLFGTPNGDVFGGRPWAPVVDMGPPFFFCVEVHPRTRVFHAIVFVVPLLPKQSLLRGLTVCFN